MTDEKRRARPAIQYGPTAAAVAANVARLRRARSWSIYNLAGALERAGRPITPSGVAKLEKEQRQVTVDDLAALAVVLGVSPAALLLPLNDRPGARVEVTGAGEVDASDAWDWAEGRRPLKPGSDEHTAELEFLVNGVPRGRRILRQHPAGRALAALQASIDALIDASAVMVDGDGEELHAVAEEAERNAGRLIAEIRHMDAENSRVRRKAGGSHGQSLD
jgi:transcriptional regulator with XRE-family HTH domain